MVVVLENLNILSHFLKRNEMLQRMGNKMGSSTLVLRQWESVQICSRTRARPEQKYPTQLLIRPRSNNGPVGESLKVDENSECPQNGRCHFLNGHMNNRITPPPTITKLPGKLQKPWCKAILVSNIIRHFSRHRNKNNNNNSEQWVSAPTAVSQPVECCGEISVSLERGPSVVATSSHTLSTMCDDFKRCDATHFAAYSTNTCIKHSTTLLHHSPNSGM